MGLPFRRLLAGFGPPAAGPSQTLLGPPSEASSGLWASCSLLGLLEACFALLEPFMLPIFLAGRWNLGLCLILAI